ncbi:MAG TPA: tetraacyldisaccharide 4'-kinase, partial [Candidatus Brocadiales bacterium]|nr:tetraacyldisaccharide 4'-kinase [Candidatus Brocadiales bacterium]
GNITMGGTGKTPMVEFVARYLSEKGKKVAILSRGYAGVRSSMPCRHGVAEFGVRSKESFVNDEYLVLSENLPDIPHLLGKNRVKSAATAIGEYGAECLILDDGFQHWKLERDLDIVVIDTLNPFDLERLIPQGALREPLRNLRRAHIFVLSHCDQCPQSSLDLIKQRLKQVNDNAPIVETSHYPSLIESLYEHTILETSWLNGKIVYAFCAVGNPESFKLTLEGLGSRVSKFTCFPDHHFYKQNELDGIIREAENLGAEAIITTQKDGVKIKGLPLTPLPLPQGERERVRVRGQKSIPLLVLKIEVRILKGKDALCGMLNAEFLSGKKNNI